jgi:ubiquinone/menaquinone biosynthesis C-methylase UbiE
MKTNDRFIWAASLMNIKPTDHLLEIGCGAGLLVEQLVLKATQGHITAIDQSVPMITMASKRNYACISSGKVALLAGNFADHTFPAASFDKIVAFNVNIFWKAPEKELALINKTIKADGQLFVFYQTPKGADLKILACIKANLQNASYQLVDEHIYYNAHSASAFGIIARPKSLHK